MSASLGAAHQFLAPKHSYIHHVYLNTRKPVSSCRQRYGVITCCSGKTKRSLRSEKNYYEVLGVSPDSGSREIREAYRKLQKKHHPDVAGQEGHEYTLLLNEAYRVLMRDDLRRDYDAITGQARTRFRRDCSDIGCRECVHHASKTFVMDEELGCARVRVQYGDDEQKLEVSVESCPVNCIYWVEKEELGLLEFLTQPQPKDGYGVFGGGWERPSNVFMAAKTLSKQLKEQPATATAATEEETPAQAKARADASMKIKMEKFSGFWKLVEHFSFKHVE
ncbi:chaperone protein dnaJ C76, chloroplastic-like isoform X3 [Syzygium oleosum]|uniref:chaperone protein dnaJ C76, chloroplastic-like isoform X3 n=1 Tax=Syzygium oleosum TaxID=219896 RepID=UPI0024BB6175|nr:chaperone protein dnaJ C76, chloroplastic-like isoform X3 [Syzygium oleosum]